MLGLIATREPLLTRCDLHAVHPPAHDLLGPILHLQVEGGDHLQAVAQHLGVDPLLELLLDEEGEVGDADLGLGLR